VPITRDEHDEGMNETLNDPGAQPNVGSPQPNPRHQDLDRLRRSTSNRYVAGVAGGLGRHFNIDPTIIRVLLVVLTFFGGAGVLIYAVCWLFVPEDGAEHAPIKVGSEPRKILLLSAAGIAFLLAMGDAFSGFNAGWPIAGVAVIIALVMISRDRRDARNNDSGMPAAPPAPATPAPYGATEPTTFLTTEATEETRAFDGGVQPPAWQPPVARPPLVRPRPKRTGLIWFWPTLALIGAALGALGIYDNSHHVADGAYPALALGITGVMLLVGSVVGRPGGLILVGFVSSIALAGNVAVGDAFGTDAQQLHDTPETAAAVQSDYAATVGEIRVDLSQVTDPAALAGREIDLHLRTGYIHVIVPRELNVNVNADMSFAGGITVPGNDGGGFNHQVEKHLAAVPATDTAPLELDIDAKFGQITVEQR
jgi:phage shock protein PspC (stress-responsive transcriptional regulator)